MSGVSAEVSCLLSPFPKITWRKSLDEFRLKQQTAVLYLCAISVWLILNSSVPDICLMSLVHLIICLFIDTMNIYSLVWITILYYITYALDQITAIFTQEVLSVDFCVYLTYSYYNVFLFHIGWLLCAVYNFFNTS